MNPPIPLAQEDWRGVQQYIVRSIAEVASTGEWPKDFEHYVFEGAMEAIYGPTIWAWIRSAPVRP